MPHPSRVGRIIRRLFWLSVLLLIGYLLWVPDVPSLKTQNPKSTALMRLRERQAANAGKKLRSTLIWRPMKEMSPHLVHAVLIAEDDRFYQHHGFDLEQIQIAVQRNWKKKSYVYGGSTITQQLARTLYLSPKKNLLRKAKEAVITIYLERTLPKKRIFEIYLNVVEWGRGIYGAEAASQAYFSKGADELTPDEAVALASVLPSPRRWSPTSERGFMARRRTQLYERMVRSGYLTVDLPLGTTTEMETPIDLNQISGDSHPPIIVY